MILYCDVEFQPTLPIRGETRQVIYSCGTSGISTHSPHPGRDAGHKRVGQEMQYFNPLSPSGERPEDWPDNRRRCPISTHSPHPGRDLKKFLCNISISPISTHSPHPGRDYRFEIWISRNKYFNPLSPSGERQQKRSKNINKIVAIIAISTKVMEKHI